MFIINLRTAYRDNNDDVMNSCKFNFTRPEVTWTQWAGQGHSIDGAAGAIASINSKQQFYSSVGNIINKSLLLSAKVINRREIVYLAVATPALGEKEIKLMMLICPVCFQTHRCPVQLV